MEFLSDWMLDDLNTWDLRGRVSDPAAALGGSQPKASGFAGEYLLGKRLTFSRLRLQNGAPPQRWRLVI
jgi:hypothetical protein